jgi:excisionase family DNA binding protein
MPNTESRPRHAHQGVTLHSVIETAELLGGCSDMHVYRLIAAGELRAVDIATPGAGRPKTRIRSDDLADYIERNTRGRTA